MLDGFNNLCLTIMDPLLNWTLSLPKDITLVILAVFSSAVLTALRLFTTKQDILKRCTADKKQLKKINRIAKSNKDKDARKRCKLTKNQILLKELLFEGKPLIASLLPIILLATWGLARLGYHPTKGDEKVTVNLYLPLSAVSKPVHLIPDESGLTTVGESTWLMEVTEDPDVIEGTDPTAKVSWTVQAPASDDSYTLRFVYDNQIYEKQLHIGRDTCLPPIKALGHGGDLPIAEIELSEYKPFGLVGGFSPLAMPPWIVGYFIIVIPLVIIFRRLTGIR